MNRYFFLVVTNEFDGSDKNAVIIREQDFRLDISQKVFFVKFSKNVNLRRVR